MKLHRLATLLSLLLLVATHAHAAPVGSAFTYQGKLNLAGIPVDGQQDFQFGLYDDNGGQIGTTATLAGIPVNQGLFTVPLDFGPNAFGNDQRLLQIMVKSPTEQDYTALTPRLKITPAPVALSVAANGVTNNSISPGAISRDKLSSDYAAYISSFHSSLSFILPYTKLQFNSVRAQKGITRASAEDFVINETGIYQISVSLDFNTNPNYNINLCINATPTAPIASGSLSSGSHVSVSRTILLPLNAGDVISLQPALDFIVMSGGGLNTITIVRVD